MLPKDARPTAEVGRALEDLFNLDREEDRVGRTPGVIFREIEGLLIPEYFFYINSEQIAGGLPQPMPLLVFFSLIVKLLLVFESAEHWDTWGFLSILISTLCLETVVAFLGQLYVEHSAALSVEQQDSLSAFMIYAGPCIVILLHILLVKIIGEARKNEARRKED